MHHLRNTFIAIGFIIALISAALFVHSQSQRTPTPTTPTSNSFALVSSAFINDGKIPARNTCQADNLSPELTFQNVPAGAKSLAIIMHDIDAPGGDFSHWLVWNIPTTTKTIREGSVPVGSVQGTTDFGTKIYGGPCPNRGIHRYHFDAYALDNTLSLTPTARRSDIENTIKTHIIIKTTLGATAAATK
ncbi:MAG: hypothetical protein NVS1B7_4480 [Candidatus Saccharimonadales bacterium]